MSGVAPPLAARRLVEELLGASTSWQVITPGQQGWVWRVSGNAGSVAVKVAARPGALERERRALEALQQPLRGSVPVLLGSATDVLVSEWIEGRSLSAPEMSRAERIASHRQAGALVRRMRDLRVEDDPLPLEQALRDRWRSWGERAAAHIAPDRWQALSARFCPELFRGSSRSWCHRDFREGNWIFGDDGVLRVIDFGQARADFWLVDLVKLSVGLWRSEPDLEEAFVLGLGEEPSGEERAQLHSLCLLHGLQTFLWGRLHGERAFESDGATTLERLVPS
jgi:thiamine kinase-like enzyme